MESRFYRRTFIKTVTAGLIGLKMFFGARLKIFAAGAAENPQWIAYLKTILPYYDRWEFGETTKKLGKEFDAGAFKKISEHLDQAAKKLFSQSFSGLNDSDQQARVVKEADSMDPDLHVGFRRTVLLNHCTRRNGFRFLGYDEDTKSELFICDLQFETYTEPMYDAEEIPREELYGLIPPKMKEELKKHQAVWHAWDVDYPEEKI
jgi:hypothetical protein